MQGLRNSRTNRSMRAAVFAGPRRARLESVELPRPGPGEIRVRLEGCGVCGSNGPLWEGRPWFRYPLAPGQGGHEGWGVVDEVGPEVAGFAEGDRVAALFQNAFAEADLAPANTAVRLPPALDRVPFPGEAIGCAMNAFRRAEIRSGDVVAVVGIGFLGAIVTGLAVRAGATVIAISRRPFALEIARRFGAAETMPMEDDPAIVRRVADMTRGVLCDRVVESAGHQRPLDLAAELTRERGRLVIAGYHQDGKRQVDMQLWNWRGLDVINAHERDPTVYVDGIRAALAAVVEGRIDPAPLYTHRFPLDRIGEAFDALERRPDGFLKALVLP